MSGVATTIWQAEWRGHDSHGLIHLIHIIIISFPKGCKILPTNTTQGHHLGASVRDDSMNHVHALEYEVSTCNIVQAGLIDVHVQLMVFKVDLM